MTTARKRTPDAGESPLDYMLRVMRDPSVDDKRRDDMAKTAAPYVHPRLSTVDAPQDVDAKGEVSVIRLVGGG